MTVMRRHAASPATLVESTFRDIERTRMAGLPILNTALAVEAVGFSPWQRNWIGALVTPWFLNLLLLPGADGDWPSVSEGKPVVWNLPGGDYRFYAGFEAAIGEYHALSLRSPMTDVADQAAARAAAQHALTVVLTPRPVPGDEPDPARRGFLGRFSRRTGG
jgi:[NiFe] hydrogenase assembly HybE family chaperone